MNRETELPPQGGWRARPRVQNKQKKCKIFGRNSELSIFDQIFLLPFLLPFFEKVILVRRMLSVFTGKKIKSLRHLDRFVFQFKVP